MKKNYKSLTFIVLTVFFVSIIAVGVSAFAEGEGSSKNPYQITNCVQLQEMNNNPNAYYILINDIDCSDTVNWNSGAGFVPIGTSLSPFTGTFDGQEHKITGLFINRPSTDYVGLFGSFGSIGSSAIIKNVGLVNVNITGNDNVGGLVGRNNYGAITNSYSTGSVTSTGYAGGLVGIVMLGGTITNSYSTGSVSGNGYSIGGLVGFNDGAITNSYATGSVTGTSEEVGGLVGENSQGTIINSYATGDVSGRNDVGGLVGENSQGTITNSYATGDVSGRNDVGGLVGLNNEGTITNSYATGSVSGGDYIGGLEGNLTIGWNSDGGAITNSYWDIETSGQSTSAGGTGKTTAEMMQQSTYENWDFVNIWAIKEGVSYPSLLWQIPPEIRTNQPPTFPFEIKQYLSDGITEIPEGDIINNDTVIFKAKVYDSDNDRIKIKVALYKFDEESNDTLGVIVKESDLVNSNEIASVVFDHLEEGDYIWKIQAIDEKGDKSGEALFGEQSFFKADFKFYKDFSFAVPSIRSALGPASWEPVSGPWDDWTEDKLGRSWNLIQSIAINPHNPQEMYVSATHHSNNWWEAVGGKLFKSVDGGVEWREITNGLPRIGEGPYYWIISAIAVSPSNPDVIYVGTSDFDPDDANYSMGVYKSIDGGDTWRPANGIEKKFPTVHNISSMVVDPINSDIIYVGTVGGGLWKTPDGGNTWKNIWSSVGEMFYNVNALAISPANLNILYAAIYNYIPLSGPIPSGIVFQGGFYRIEILEDGNHVSKKIFGNRVDDIVVDSKDANVLHVVTYGYRVYKSVDGGTRWNDVSGNGGEDPLPAVYDSPTKPSSSLAMNHGYTSMLFASSMWGSTEAHGVHFSPNSGKNWFPVGLQDENVNKISIASDLEHHVLYAVTTKSSKYQVRLFKFDFANKAIVVQEYSPVEIRVYDSEGRVTGLINGETKAEIPKSVYSNGTITVFPLTSSYQYEVVGVGEGLYGLKVISAEGLEVAKFTATGIPITSGQIHQYSVDWDALNQGKNGVTVGIDKNGDGTFENQFTAGAILEGVTMTAPPTASPVAGTYTSPQSVTLTAPDNVSSIHYTTDGTIPTCSTGTVYSSPIPVNSSETINAISCYATSLPSAVVSFAYVINIPSPSNSGGGGSSGGSNGGGGGGGGGGDDEDDDESPSAGKITPQVAGASISRQDQIKAFYQNIFNRIPKAAELNYWVGMASSLNEVKRNFFVSNEYNRKITDLTNKQGKKAGIEKLYKDIFGRPIKKNDLDWWLKRDTNILGIRFNFMNSGEYQARFDDKQITERRKQIAALYHNILLRAPDTARLNYWDKSKFSIKKIREEMLKSKEFFYLSQNLEKQRGRKVAFEHLFESVFNAAADNKSYDYYATQGKGGSLDNVRKILIQNKRYQRQNW